ncbi:MAG TPA: sulfotransferase [Stellaceae bacterium]|nr:sulfotransferase [Stellaceae bacterium]
MGIRGSLDAVERFQIRGWAFDPDNPTHAVQVEILLDDKRIAAVPATLYREDLERSGEGDGRHAFVVNMDAPLADADLPRVMAKAFDADGAFLLLPKGPHAAGIVDPANHPAPPTPKPIARISVETSHIDETQRPVFVLGAARSGTSAMAQALLKLGTFEGHEEGHMLDLLAHLSVTVTSFYRLNADEIAGDRNTAVVRVPPRFYQEGLDGVFIELVRRLYPTGRWIDKTPNSDMVHLAPRFKKIWPQARFIFMRRRFLENAVSRSRKFPHHSFERTAREWAQAMDGWLQVRDHLRGAAVEIDQKFLSEQPEIVSQRLAPFLSLTAVEEARLSQALRYDRPERTSAIHQEDCDLSQMGWGEHERGYFAQYCEKLLSAYGYSIDASYYLPDFDKSGFVYA